MRRVLAIVLLLVAFAATIGAPAALADPSPEAALGELNTWRGQLGLPAVSTLNSTWNTGCQHHDNYVHLNGNALTHTEEMGHAGYTSDGAEAGSSSVLASRFSAPNPTPDAALLPGPVWDGAVFHRAQLLNPRLAQTGFDSTTFLQEGVYRSFTCMRTLNGTEDASQATPGLTLYPSPANGAYDVPTTFPGFESPDPNGETGVPPGSTLGWLLNVEINGPWSNAAFGYAVNAHDVTATLAPDGTSNFVPLVVSQCGPSGCGGGGGTSLGAYFGGGFGIFPTQALAANTTYRVVLTGGTVTDHSAHVDYPIPAGYSWCFSTGAVYTASADCAAPSAAAAEPAGADASTVPSFTPPAIGEPTGRSLERWFPSTPAPSRAPAVRCTVPKLAGKSLKAARKKLAAAHCKLGKVTKEDGATAKTGEAGHQSAKPGAQLPAGTKVNVTLKPRLARPASGRRSPGRPARSSSRRRSSNRG